MLFFFERTMALCHQWFLLREVGAYCHYWRECSLDFKKNSFEKTSFDKTCLLALNRLAHLSGHRR